MYFKLRDHIYEVTSSVVRLLCDPWEDTFGMDIDIYAESKDEALDPEMRELRLYHNNGFETGESHYLALKGKKYIWTSKFNELGEEAGFLYVQEHEFVTSGMIEILDVNIETIRMRWTGNADVDWNSEFDSDVPFETEFEAELAHPLYEDHPSIWIDADTVLHIQNPEALFAESERLSALYQSGDSDAMKKWNVTLQLRLELGETSYDGEAVYCPSVAPCIPRFDGNCPVKLRIKDITRFPQRGRLDFSLALDE